jgi:predicted DNA-binding transcriptional regulator AlpA
MIKATRGTIEQARLLTLQQACIYTGMGRDKCREWCKKNRAFLKIGTLARYDKSAIDATLDAMTTPSATS